MIKIIKIKALVGSTIKIKKAPINVPMNAPKTGINAVKPTNTDIVEAYGICNISIPIKHNIPMIRASKHCPLIKLPKVVLESAAISLRRFSFFSGR